MNRSIRSLLFFLLTLAAANVYAGSYDRDSLLHELDKAVASAHHFRDLHEARIKAAFTELTGAAGHEEKLRCARNLSNLYYFYQNDSALAYNSKCLDIAESQTDHALYVSLMCERAVLLGIGGMPQYGINMLDSLSRNPLCNTPELKRTVYESLFDVNDYLYHFNLPGSLQTQNDIYLASIRDSFYHYCPQAVDQAMRTTAAYTSAKEIIDHLIEKLNHAQTDMERATLAMVISNRYQSISMTEQREIYLILSAIYHIRAARMDNEALIKLGKEMMENGDWSRAEAYISLAHEQALHYGSRSREVQLSPLLKRLQAHIDGQRSVWKTVGVVGILASLLVIGICIVQWFFTRKRIAALNTCINSLRKDSKSASKREAISQTQAENQAVALTHFMNIATDAIFEFVNLRHFVIRRLKNEEAAELLQQMTVENNSSESQTKLLRKFDIAFLRLYPDFITKVNALMLPDSQVSKPEKELMSTELRLLALWRLGITEAGRVATILNLSVNTIYFYRNKLRAGAKDREHFNDGIMAIQGS